MSYHLYLETRDAANDSVNIRGFDFHDPVRGPHADNR